MTEPKDAEIWQMWMPMVRRMGVADPVEFARAVLAKWGTPPAVAGEQVAPDFYTACALYEEGGEAGWIPLPGYSNETEHGVKHLVLEAARKEGYKGTVAGRLLELGWEIRPVYLTQQPTQAQAGAVPLTPEQIESLLYKYGYDPDDEHMAEMLQAAVSLKRTPHAG
jgi:hypothetical protein